MNRWSLPDIRDQTSDVGHARKKRRWIDLGGLVEKVFGVEVIEMATHKDGRVLVINIFTVANAYNPDYDRAILNFTDNPVRSNAIFPES